MLKVLSVIFIMAIIAAVVMVSISPSTLHAEGGSDPLAVTGVPCPLPPTPPKETEIMSPVSDTSSVVIPIDMPSAKKTATAIFGLG